MKIFAKKFVSDWGLPVMFIPLLSILRNNNVANVLLKPVYLYAFLENGLFKHLIARFFMELLENDHDKTLLNYIYQYILHIQVPC
jgi:hypothetical protein